MFRPLEKQAFFSYSLVPPVLVGKKLCCSHKGKWEQKSNFEVLFIPIRKPHFLHQQNPTEFPRDGNPIS